MRRRLDLAIALLGDPELLILDEPTNGLDPMGIVEVRKILTHLNKDQGKTILVSSHNLEEMHKLATDYLFISHGRLIRRMTAPQLEKSCRGGFVLHVDDLERTRSVLGDETSHSFLPDGSVLMRYEEKKEGRGIAIEALSTAGVRVAEAYSHRKSLEEFLFGAHRSRERAVMKREFISAFRSEVWLLARHPATALMIALAAVLYVVAAVDFV